MVERAEPDQVWFANHSSAYKHTHFETKEAQKCVASGVIIPWVVPFLAALGFKVIVEALSERRLGFVVDAANQSFRVPKEGESFCIPRVGLQADRVDMIEEGSRATQCSPLGLWAGVRTLMRESGRTYVGARILTRR